jgi:PAS domain S-box-containing protein
VAARFTQGRRQAPVVAVSVTSAFAQSSRSTFAAMQNLPAAAYLAAIVDSSDDAIVSKTLEGVITSWNKSAERMFGYSAAEAVGRNITLVIPQERLDEEREVLLRLSRGERIEHFETVRRRKDGSAIHVSLTVSPIKDDSGRIIGASKVARDISDRIRIENDMREADRRKDEFLATLAHELRNPLAPLRSGVQILRVAGGVANQPTLDAMDRQLAHMVRLIDDLLDVSRISSGKVHLRREVVNVKHVLDAALDTLLPAARQRRQQVLVTLPAEPIYIDGDPARMAQVFANLLDNAVKYSPAGAPIRIVASRDNGTATIDVVDIGRGVPESLRGAIFEAFVQAPDADGSAPGGLGLGLALVKRFVEMHGGSVECLPGEGAGSIFRVRLPTAAPGASATAPAGSEPLGAAGGRRRVLVVDDNRDAATSLARLLELLGHEAFIAFDGAQGLELALKLKPDAVLLDLGMPNMSGFEACRRIRDAEGGSDTLVIALTGWGREEDRAQARAAGFDAHFVKPVDLAALTRYMAGKPPPSQPSQ